MTETKEKTARPILTLASFNKDKTTKPIAPEIKKDANKLSKTTTTKTESQIKSSKKEQAIENPKALKKDQKTQALSKDKPKKPKKKLLLPKEKIESLLTYLRSEYPKAFTIPVSILAIGIHNQLNDSELDKPNSPLNKRIVFKIMRVYSSMGNYRQAHIEGAPRLNLDGSTHSVITAEQVKGTEDSLKELNKQVKPPMVAA